jgi:2-polyprenyl-3-methyl-5-hydroxy-6-metoxy-1,4-benzoquinol methylase
MNILVAMANYGTRNDVYLRRLLDEYRAMPHHLDIVVLSDQPKNLGPGVEVRIERPKGNPWTFPFAHKQILAERCRDYDLFIYSEDDTLITECNINAFLTATEVLREDEIAGFLRYETEPGGTIYCSSVHSHFHWDPRSVVSRGNSLFAFFTNEHSASYILTQKQLRQAIDSGGFLVKPHQGRYDLLVTAATDPYTQCGFKKMINISHLWDFVLPHLPNKYVGQLGVSRDDLNHQIAALKLIANQAHPPAVLFESETKLPAAKWSKAYYEKPRIDIQKQIPANARSVLSYGCGWGELEGLLVQSGMCVTALPIDSVIGACAEARGIRVINGNSDQALSQISTEHFDCVLLLGVLHLLPQPEKVLSQLEALMSPGSVIFATVPNMAQLPILWRRLTGQRGFRHLGNYERTGTQFTSSRTVRRWFEQSKLRIKNVVPIVPLRVKRWATISSKTISENLLASELLFTVTRR